MIELAYIVAKYGEEYVNEFGNRMLPSHKRALTDSHSCTQSSERSIHPGIFNDLPLDTAMVLS